MFEVDKSLALKISAPKEAGINKQKEKLKASIVDNPNSKPIKIVDPARETPGRMAIA